MQSCLESNWGGGGSWVFLANFVVGTWGCEKNLGVVAFLILFQFYDQVFLKTNLGGTLGYPLPLLSFDFTTQMQTEQTVS